MTKAQKLAIAGLAVASLAFHGERDWAVRLRVYPDLTIFLFV